MARNAPGKFHRQGLTLFDVAAMFCDEAQARRWLEEQRWPDGPVCPHCNSRSVKVGVAHPSMTHRCNACSHKPMFSVKTGTVMEGSKLAYRAWAVGIYLFSTNIKGVSSMRLHRELGITQKSAWFMLARLRKAYEASIGPFSGAVEVDETYIGGLEKNKHASKKLRAGRGAVGKTAVVGVKERETGQVVARVTRDTTGRTLKAFVEQHTEADALVHTDEARAYQGLNRRHETVAHSVGEYVRGQAHTNGMESFWSLLKRGFEGTFHKISPKHLDRYVTEFVGRHNVRNWDTIAQMAGIVAGMNGKRIRYWELIADNGLSSGARSLQCGISNRRQSGSATTCL